MSTITKPYTFANNTIADPAQVNSDFDTIFTDYNGNISNANIAADAAIATTKIAGTALTLTGTEVATNKTFTKPTMNGVIVGVATYSPTGGGTATLDCAAATRHVITMPAGNITIAVTNASTSQPFIVEIIQDVVGSRTVTWFSTIKWTGGSAPTLTTTASKKDTFGFITTSSGNYDGYTVGKNI